MAGKTGKSPGAAGKRRPASEGAAPASGAAARAALRKRGARGATVEAHRAKGGFWLRVEVPLEAAAALLGE
ncbi:hypothetical protein [Sorangium sp. So ce1182]|uniref:hypothetical protein n=1 Tax=Sorangium sp. So ce1182 TaxID=3133334 RepID=UPI003F5F9B05